MRFLVNEQPGNEVDISFILMDWSCRESFHILDYLADQSINRCRYELIWIEYGFNPSAELCKRIDAARVAGKTLPVDIYAIMEMPEGLCYHKHLMMNLGICLANGRIICWCDSDAMVRPTFVKSIIESFEQNENIVLHLDEVRNNDPSFYPFNHPTFDEVTGFGSINWVNGMPTGLLDTSDPLHSRNYGACMAALRDDMIAIGGADMHIDYLGHICGPYEITWRLVNAGKREMWHSHEWLYHVWHPGQAGDQNFAGPHDGLHISLRALWCRAHGQTLPFAENPAIALLRNRLASIGDQRLLDALIDPLWLNDWQYKLLTSTERHYSLGKRSITLKVRDGSDSTDSLRPQVLSPLFGRKFNRFHLFALLPIVPGIVWRQLKVKYNARTWASRRYHHSATKEWLRKINALMYFLKRILAFNKHWFRACWLTLAYAEQSGRQNIIVYGDGDAARILCVMSKYLPITIRSICPFHPNVHTRLFGHEVISEEQFTKVDETVIIAAFVNVPVYLTRLEKLGINRDRILTIR